MVMKPIYTTKELDAQMDYHEHKCGQCLHECRECRCKTQQITMKMAERTPGITTEQKQRYFALVGA